MTKPLVVFIDDEPNTALTKLREIDFIQNKRAELWLLSPVAINPTPARDLKRNGVTQICTDNSRLTPGYNRRDFVQWCKTTMKSQMFRTVAIFIDYMIDSDHPTIKHWQYAENGNTFEGMKDLINYLRNFNPITKFFIFTQFSNQTENYIDGTIDKSKALGEIRYIKDTYDMLTERLSYKHKFAWLDKHEFELVYGSRKLKKSLYHCTYNSNVTQEAIFACKICNCYLRDIITNAKIDHPNIYELFPKCIEANCANIGDKHLISDVWKRFYLEFILFKNPDLSILYSILTDRNDPRYDAISHNGFESPFTVQINQINGVLELCTLPYSFEIVKDDKTITIVIDNSLNYVNNNTDLPRTDNSISGRHYDDNKSCYCTLFPWEANIIGSIIFDNLFSKYANKKLTIKSSVNSEINSFVIEFDHLCETDHVPTSVKYKQDGQFAMLGINYTATYINIDDKTHFQLLIYIPINNYGQNPWGINE